MITPETINTVARAIYMTHRQNQGFVLEHAPPEWGQASGAIQDWVRLQAVSAIEAYEGVTRPEPVETQSAAE